MSPRRTYPVRRCAPCNTDWPNIEAYNLCQACLRCTYASTATVPPDTLAARAAAERYERVREFDANCDRAAEMTRDAWVVEMEALLEQTASIPDPSPYSNPQRVDFRRPPLTGATD